jgi:hypothetical protein
VGSSSLQGSLRSPLAVGWPVVSVVPQSVRESSPVVSVCGGVDDGQRRDAGPVPAAVTTMNLLFSLETVAWVRR